MAAPPKIFVSATSGDLRTTRSAVKEALLTIGCYPIEQTNFPPDYRTVRQMLEAKIRECQALIHLVGMRYGEEPDPASFVPGASRRSYTQLEYDTGRALARKYGDKRFRVYTFVCAKEYPYDTPSADEPEEKRALQRSHRREIQAGDVVYESLANVEAVKTRVLSLREETIQLRAEYDRLRRTNLVISVLALLAVVIGMWVTWRVTGTMKADIARQHQELADTRDLFWQVVGRSVTIPNRDNVAPAERFDRAVGDIAEQQGVDEATLKADIDTFIAKVKSDPKADPLDRALANFAAREFDDAEVNAELAAAEARRRRATGGDPIVEGEVERKAVQLAADARSAKELRESHRQREDVLGAEERKLVQDLDKSVARDVDPREDVDAIEAWFCNRMLRGNQILWTLMRQLGNPTLPDDYRVVPKAARDGVIELEKKFIENILAEVDRAKAIDRAKAMSFLGTSCADAWRNSENWDRAVAINLPVQDQIVFHPTDLEVDLADFLTAGRWALTTKDSGEPDVYIHLVPPLASIDPAWGERALALLADAEKCIPHLHDVDDDDYDLKWINPNDVDADSEWRRMAVADARGRLLIQLGRRQQGLDVLQEFLRKNPKSPGFRDVQQQLEFYLGLDGKSAAIQNAIAACQDVDRIKLSDEVARVWDMEGAGAAARLQQRVTASCPHLSPAVNEAFVLAAAFHDDCAAIKGSGATGRNAMCE
jgi:hypothetical protein